MTRVLVAMPIPSGLDDKLDAFAREVDARHDEYRDSRTRIGVTRERGWVQRTPDGDVFLLMLEGADPIEANRRWAASDLPFDVWFKDTVGPMFGVDFSQPFPVQPEPIYSSVPAESDAKQSVAVALPLLPGMTDAHRQMGSDLQGPMKERFDAFHERAGVLEDWWIEQTPAGDLALVYLESDDLAAAMAHLAASEEPTEMWFKERLLEHQGVDWSGPPPPLPRLVFDWRP